MYITSTRLEDFRFSTQLGGKYFLITEYGTIYRRNLYFMSYIY